MQAPDPRRALAATARLALAMTVATTVACGGGYHVVRPDVAPIDPRGEPPYGSVEICVVPHRLSRHLRR